MKTIANHKLLIALILALGLAPTLLAQPKARYVLAEEGGVLLAPQHFFGSNLFAGTNIFLEPATNGRNLGGIRINASGGGGGSGDVTTAQLNSESNSLVSQITAVRIWVNTNSTNLPVSGSSVEIPMLTTIRGSNDSSPAVLRIVSGSSAVVCTDSRLQFLSKQITSDDNEDILNSGVGFKNSTFDSAGLSFRGHAADPSNTLFQAGAVSFQGNYWSANFGGYSATAQFFISEEITDGQHFKLKFLANTDDDGDLGNASVDQAGVWTANGVASLSSLSTNAVTDTGWTNSQSINVTAYLTATAASFTINNRDGTVLYTSPTLTATLPVNLQPGWSVRAASGLVGTVLPF